MSRNWRRGAPCRWKAIGSLPVGAAGSNFESATAVTGGSGSVPRVGASSAETPFSVPAFGIGSSLEPGACRQIGKRDTARDGPTSQRRK